MPDPSRPIAVVIEGGGMRGAYAAGATLATHDLLGPRIGGYFATSSGAGTAAYAAAGQREGLAIWQDHLHGSRLVHPWRFLVGRPVLDVDYLIDEVFRRRVPLDVRRLRAFPGVVEVTATHADTGLAHVFDLHRDDPFEALRCTTSLPGAVRKAVAFDGGAYVDGGLSQPIPIDRALHHGFGDIVVVLTRPHGYRKGAIGGFAHWLVRRDFPGLSDALRRQHERYNSSLELLEKPPEGVRLSIVRPDARLEISRWTRSRRKLLAAIEAGRNDASRALSGLVR